ncbi:Shr3 amino acid permease chaperone [Mycena filopes]|nr:Shr3 amino acid permease chaperone [Mycena filopes]
MGFAAAVVSACCAFFLGVLYICLNIDHRVLWGDLTPDTIEDGFQFYTTFFNAPPAIKALLHGMVGVIFLGLIAKLHVWDDSAMFFDGSSIVSLIFALSLYLTVVVPALRTIVTPLEEETRSDRIQAMQLLSAANIIIMVCLGLILLLQAGQEYARRADAREQQATKVDAEGKKKGRETKKKQ